MQNSLTVLFCCRCFLSSIQILQKTCVNKEVKVEVCVYPVEGFIRLFTLMLISLIDVCGSKIFVIKCL